MHQTSLEPLLVRHAPVIVTSPAIRCGTTLVQRLLSSSKNVLLYGEDCGRELEFSLTVFASKAMMYRFNRAQFDARLQGFLAGDVNDWILDLMPPVDEFVARLGSSFFSWVDYLAEYAGSLGRPRWGIKYPGWTPPVLTLLREAMPNARLVYVHRDLGSCLRSAKAFEAITARSEIRSFCDSWRLNMEFARSLEGQAGVLHLPYSRLQDDGEAAVEEIEHFTGAEGIDRSLLSRKVNRRSEDGSPAYTPPSPLTEEEERLVAETEAALEVRRASSSS